MAMAFFLLCISSLLLIFITTYIFQPLIVARRRLPPGPRRLPLIGNIHNLGKDPHRTFARLADRYGPLVSVRLGGVRAVVASSSDVAKEILHVHNADLAGRGGMDAWHACGHHANSIIALPPRRKWRALRKLCTEELFAPRRLAELRAVREEKARELARAVSWETARGGGGSPVAVARAVFPAVAGVLWRSMFSEDLDVATARELGDMVREAVVVAGKPNLSDYFPALAAADVLGVRRRMEKLVAWAYGVIDRQIDQRRRGRAAGEPRRNDLLDAALDMEGHVEGTEGWVMNQETMRGMFMDLLVAGSGSTTSTIEWAMAELLRHPRCMAKAQDELRRVVGARPHVAEPDVDLLPYLQAVVKETLRLHPTVPIGLNKAEAAVVVQGYRIPEGTTVYVNIWAICRSAKAWGDDADEFVPERFIGRDDDVGFLGNSFELIPFGAGRRICLGLPLAERMLHLMLASLLHRFEWAVADDGGGDGGDSIDMAERFGLVLSMATPLRAVAKEVK